MSKDRGEEGHLDTKIARNYLYLTHKVLAGIRAILSCQLSPRVVKNQPSAQRKRRIMDHALRSFELTTTDPRDKTPWGLGLRRFEDD